MRFCAGWKYYTIRHMKERSFLACPCGAVSLLCRPASVDEAVALARTALDAGADGVTVELNRFPVAARTRANFREIVSSVPLPFMFTDYREDEFLGPHFGCAVEFAVHDYIAGTPYNQPTIRNFKKAAAAIAWQMPGDEGQRRA